MTGQRMHLFGIGLDNQLYHIWQTQAACVTCWSGWRRVGDGAIKGELVVARHPGCDRCFEVFAVGMDSKVHHIWNTVAGTGESCSNCESWSGWAGLGELTVTGGLAVNHDRAETDPQAVGGLSVYAVGPDDRIRRARQTCATCTAWSAWRRVGNYANLATSTPAVGGGTPAVMAPTRKAWSPEIFALGPDNRIHRFVERGCLACHDWEPSSELGITVTAPPQPPSGAGCRDLDHTAIAYLKQYYIPPNLATWLLGIDVTAEMAIVEATTHVSWCWDANGNVLTIDKTRATDVEELTIGVLAKLANDDSKTFKLSGPPQFGGYNERVEIQIGASGDVGGQGGSLSIACALTSRGKYYGGGRAHFVDADNCPLWPQSKTGTVRGYSNPPASKKPVVFQPYEPGGTPVVIPMWLYAELELRDATHGPYICFEYGEDERGRPCTFDSPDEASMDRAWVFFRDPPVDAWTDGPNREEVIDTFGYEDSCNRERDSWICIPVT